MIVYEETDLRLLGNGTIIQMRLDQYGNEKPLLVARILYVDPKTAQSVRQSISTRWRALRTRPQHRFPPTVCNLPLLSRL